MKEQHVVLARAGELPELNPTAPDVGPINRDFGAILAKLTMRARIQLYQELSRVEVLMRLAWGAYPLLRFLGTCHVLDQTPAGEAVRSAAECLFRNYPFGAASEIQGGLGAESTLGAINLPTRSAGEGGKPSSGLRPPDSSPCAPDTADLSGPGRAAGESLPPDA